VLAVPAAAVVVDLALDWVLRRVAAAEVLRLLRVLLVLLLELAADLAHKPLLLAQVLLQVEAVLVPLLAVVAVPVVELPLNRHSSSAAMARITTSPPPPYDPVPRSR